MKILWVSNTIFPDLSKALGNTSPAVGGWMYGLAISLSKADIELTVVTSRPKVKAHSSKINGISYHLMNGEKPIIKFDKSLKDQWKHIISEAKPDLVHIHGTEYAHGLSLMKTYPNLKYVISIQGLISVCARYYEGNISLHDINKHKTFRDFIKRDGILKSKKQFQKRGEAIEKTYLELSKHFIGRTQWDLNHIMTNNKTANYHFCNETLRNNFYSSRKWNIKTIKKNSIFLSQSIYPIKGLHKVIKAISIIADEFPDLILRVAGANITQTNSILDKFKLSGYGNYLNHLIIKYKLKDRIEFTGVLNENQMIEEYLNCNLFICPSSIENSPNSLGEAQILGVPCIASYVGGIPDMVKHGESGLLYRFEEVEMMAQSIKNIISNTTLAKKLSQGGITAASERHDKSINLKRTLEIYQTILAK